MKWVVQTEREKNTRTRWSLCVVFFFIILHCFFAQRSGKFRSIGTFTLAEKILQERGGERERAKENRKHMKIIDFFMLCSFVELFFKEHLSGTKWSLTHLVLVETWRLDGCGRSRLSFLNQNGWIFIAFFSFALVTEITWNILEVLCETNLNKNNQATLLWMKQHWNTWERKKNNEIQLLSSSR